MTHDRIQTLLALRHDPEQTAQANADLRAAAVPLAFQVVARDLQLSDILRLLRPPADLHEDPDVARQIRERAAAMLRWHAECSRSSQADDPIIEIARILTEGAS